MLRAATHDITVEARSGEIKFGRDMTADEQQYVHDVLATALTRIEEDREAPTPRVVLIVPEYETVESKTYDPKLVTIGSGFEAVVPPPVGVDVLDGNDGPVEVPYWHLSEQRQTNRPLNCPDCGRELIAAPDPQRAFDYLICPAAVRVKPPTDVAEGCVVACGKGA